MILSTIRRWSTQNRGTGSANRRRSKALSTARSFWESNPEIASKDKWTANPLIGASVYSQISAGESTDHWLDWLLRDYFKNRRFARVLSPGCGVGDHEVAMMSFGSIAHLDAFDFSEASLWERSRQERHFRSFGGSQYRLPGQTFLSDCQRRAQPRRIVC